MADLAFRPAAELGAAIRRRELGCRELLEHHLARVERLNPRINAIVTLDVEAARRRADAADRAVAGGEPLGPLHGLPMTIKDALETTELVIPGEKIAQVVREREDPLPDRNARQDGIDQMGGVRGHPPAAAAGAEAAALAREGYQPL